MKKKVLFINGHLNTGGVEKALLDVLRHLDYDKFDVDLLLTEQLGDYASELPKQVNVILRSIEGTCGSFPKVILSCIRRRDWFSLKMRMIFLSMRFFGIARVSSAKKMLTNGREYDCVIGFRRGFCTQIAAYAVNARRRITWWHHGTVNVETKDYLAETSKCDQVVAVSESCRNMLIQAMPSLESRLVTICNMLDAAAVREKAKEFEPCFEKAMLHLVSVGRLAPEKHFDNVLYAAKELKERGIVFKWHLIGDGELREELQKQATKLEVSDCVIFEGNQVNPYPFMRAADVFVHPSYVESFGIVVAEALALGAACVVTKSMGILDFLIDGENALLTEQSPEALTEKLLQVIENDELRERLRLNARCPKQFLPDAVINKIENLL